MNINIGDARLVLLCPAWKKWGAVRTVKENTDRIARLTLLEYAEVLSYIQARLYPQAPPRPSLRQRI